MDLQISRSNESHYRNRMDDLMDAMDSYTVRAPVSGVVIYKRDWNNEAKASRQQYFWHGYRYGNSGPVHASGPKSSRRNRFRQGQSGTGSQYYVDAVQGKSFIGKVVSIGTILKQATFDRPQKVNDTYVRYQCWRHESAASRHESEGANPGRSVSKQVVVIPLSSIQERDGRSFVQVWQPETKSFEWREIQLQTNDGMTAVVESGLNANEKIRIKPKA